jgi:hypothetical protein
VTELDSGVAIRILIGSRRRSCAPSGHEFNTCPFRLITGDLQAPIPFREIPHHGGSLFRIHAEPTRHPGGHDRLREERQERFDGATFAATTATSLPCVACANRPDAIVGTAGAPDRSGFFGQPFPINPTKSNSRAA